MVTQDSIKIILISFICCSSVLVSCQNKNANEQHTNYLKTNNNVISKIIVNQFVELANAIKDRDCERLKMFFVFPVNNQYIWHKVLFDNEIERKNVSELFTEKDFEKYCSKFFDVDIEKTIATLNLENLSNENLESDTVAIRNGIYLNKCVLSIYITDKHLIFSVLSNLYNENDEFLSEHIDKYYFTLIDNKLIFSDFEMID